MARGFPCKTGGNERGAEAVEFALVVPLLLTLVFGIIDFGYMMNRDTIVNNASREGAREGALNPTSDAIKCTVRRALVTIEQVGTAADCAPSSTQITVTVTCLKPDDITPCSGTFPADAVPGGTVIVKVDDQHLGITPVGGTFFPSGIKLSKTTYMRIE